MQNTNIQWTDHTVNFWWGCTKVSRACKHCYAETVAKVFGKRLFGSVPQWGAGKPRFERLEKARAEALKIQKRAKRDQDGFEGNAEEARKHGAFIDVPPPQRPKVFVNSMSDWLDDEVPLEWLAYLLETLAMCPNVDFQLLTKRPENWRDRVMKVWASLEPVNNCDFGPFSRWLSTWNAGTAPANLWIGCTVEDQAAADTRIPHLLNIPAKVRFLSCEPLVGAIDLNQCATVDIINPQGVRSYTRPLFDRDVGEAKRTQGYTLGPCIHWIIAGGESGGPAEPTHPDWLRSLRDQCAVAGVAFFFKQWGEWIDVSNVQPHMNQRAYPGRRLEDDTLMLRVGVDTAGAELDGVKHLAFPQ